MHFIVLKFGSQRAQAGAWMAAHLQWIQQGIDDGVFLMAGSLDAAQGGALLATGVDREALLARVQQDPFVAHGVVQAEVHTVTPSRMVPGLRVLLDGARAPTGAG